MKGFGFTPEKEKETLSSENMGDLIHARLLNTTLMINKLIIKDLNITKTAKEFRGLRIQDKIDIELIDAIMEWLPRHVKDEYFPVIRSGKSFRDKFLQLKFAYERSQKPIISPEAEEIVKRLENLYWPKGSMEGLTGAVQTSLRNYQSFLVLLGDLKKKCEIAIENNRNRKYDEWKRLLRLTEILQENGLLRNPISFVEEWFQNVNEEVQNWILWNGSFSKFVLDLKEQRFLGLLSDCVWQYTKDRSAWEMLKKELIK